MEFDWTDFPLYFSIGNYTDHVFKSDQDFTLNICPADTVLLCDGDLELSVAIEDGIYEWSTGENTPAITVNQPGTYILEASNFCGVASDTVVVLGPVEDPIQIMGDTIFCDGDQSTLTAVNVENYTNFEWSTGEISPSIQVSTTGIYSLTATDLCDNSTSANFGVTGIEAPIIIDLELDTDPCEGEGVTLTPILNDTPIDYSWSTGEINASIEVCRIRNLFFGSNKRLRNRCL